jgi:predicted PurR-regulated permease PerM
MLREVEATLQHYISCKLLVSLAAGVGVGCAYAVRAHSQTRDTCDMG